MSRPPAGLTLAVLLLVAAPAHADGELPRPDLSNLAEVDREQVERQRGLLDALLEVEDTTAATLADAYGELGQIYFLYDLMDVAETCFDNALARAAGDFRWHYYLGVLHRREGRFEAAAEALGRAGKIRPEDVPTLLHTGLVTLETGYSQEAARAFAAALELDASSAAALFGLGLVAASAGNQELAIDRFRLALAADPGATSIHHPLGMALRRIGDREGALSHLALNRHDPVTFADPLIDGLDGLLRGARVFLRAGNRAMAAGDLASALGFYQRAAVVDPEDPLIQYNLGWALAARGDRDAAIERFRGALELDPAHRDAHYNLALALASREQYAEAATHFEAAYRIDDEDHQAHLDWATALAATGDQRRAVHELEDLISRDPANIGALENLSVLYAGRGDLAGAVRMLERLVAAEPPPDQGIAARRSLGRLLGRLGRFLDAAVYFGEIVAIAPEDDGAHFGRAISLILGEDYGGALEALAASLSERSSNLALAHLEARLLATSPDDAVRDGERALAAARRIFEAEQTLDHAETLAMALAEVGQAPEAARIEREVVAELERAGAPPATAAKARRRLLAYEAGRVVRAPWKDG